MKELEFTLSSDKQSWMDTSVISDTPNKVTIIDPRPFVDVLVDILGTTQSIQDEEYPRKALEHLAKASVRSVMLSIIGGRRAWVNGVNAEVALHPIELKKMFGFDLDPIVRDKLRYELDFDQDEITLASLHQNNLVKGMDKSKNAAVRLVSLLQDISDLMKKHMNANQFVVHELTTAKDGRTFWLEEYADWRVIQYTKAEQEKIAARHENI